MRADGPTRHGKGLLAFATICGLFGWGSIAAQPSPETLETGMALPGVSECNLETVAETFDARSRKPDLEALHARQARCVEQLSAVSSRSEPLHVDRAARGTGNTISGTVTASDTGLPIEGVVVCFVKRETLSSAAPCETTAASGNYVSDPIVPDTPYAAYTVQSPGYSREVYDNLPFTEFSDLYGATGIDLTQSDATGIDFVLGPLPDPATVNGLVTDAATADPVEGALVAISDVDGFGVLASGTTDGAGLYSIEVPISAGTRGALPPADRNIVAEVASQNHAPVRFGVAGALDCYFNCAGTDGAFPVASGTTTSVDVQLSAGGSFEGNVVASATGTPIEGARIEVSSASGQVFSGDFQPITDAAGNYRLPYALPPGSYFLRASVSGQNFVTEAWNDIACEWRACPILDTDPLMLSAGATETGIDFALDAGAVIEAAVGGPGRMFVYDGAGRFLGFAFGSPGRIEGLEGGSYYLDIGPTQNTDPYLRQLHNGTPCPYKECTRDRGEPLTVAPGGVLDGLQYELVEGGQIAGRFVDAATGAPVPVDLIPDSTRLGSVDLVDAQGVVWGAADLNYDGTDVVMTARYGVPPGQYYLRTYDTYSDGGVGFHPPPRQGIIPGYVDQLYDGANCVGQACNLGAATPITFSAGAETDITVELEEGSNVSGSVVDDASGDALAEITVKLVDSSNETLAAAVTDDAGVFEFGAFPAGSYYLRTSASGQPGKIVAAERIEYFDKLWGSPGNCSEALCDPADGTAITLDGTNDGGPIELRMTPGPTIRGRIIDRASGLSINGGRVDVFTDTGEFVGTYPVDPFDGHYQTTALPPGTYTLVPEVSPAYVVDTDSGAPGRRAVRGPVAGFGVTLGSTSVEADTIVAENYIFGDEFE